MTRNAPNKRQNIQRRAMMANPNSEEPRADGGIVASYSSSLVINVPLGTIAAAANTAALNPVDVGRRFLGPRGCLTKEGGKIPMWLYGTSVALAGAHRR